MASTRLKRATTPFAGYLGEQLPARIDPRHAVWFCR
jgi:hypothetical protein